MLDRLPSEVVYMILEKLPIRDLKAICQASRTLHGHATAVLYETITIQIDDRGRPLPHSSTLLSIDKKQFNSTRSLIFDRENLRSQTRCVHYRLAHPEAKDSEDEEVDTGETVREDKPYCHQLLPFLRLVQDDFLREFVWRVGACAPPALFDELGYLCTHQRRITKLSLITEAECLRDYSPLTTFNCLQSLSWKGINTPRDFDVLFNWIQASCSTLGSLEIDVTSWHRPPHLSVPGQSARARIMDYELTQCMLKLDHGNTFTQFPSLQRLSLSCVSLDTDSPDLLYSLDFKTLRSLTLWNCSGTNYLLNELADLDVEEANLTYIEIVLDTDVTDPSLEDDFKEFFTSFTGLVDVYIMISGPAQWDQICSAIDNHQHTLKHLVLHERLVDNNEDSSRFREICDGDIWWYEEVDGLLCHSRLDCLGISNDCRVLMENLQRLDPRPICRILHVRSSRMDDDEEPSSASSPSSTRSRSLSTPTATAHSARNLDSFIEEYFNEDERAKLADFDLESFIGRKSLFDLAQWAFGATGLPNLQIIAYGDFSHNGRYKEYTQLLCRKVQGLDEEDDDNDRNFRALRDDDYFLQDLVRENMGFLGACVIDC